MKGYPMGHSNNNMVRCYLLLILLSVGIVLAGSVARSELDQNYVTQLPIPWDQSGQLITLRISPDTQKVVLNLIGKPMASIGSSQVIVLGRIWYLGENSKDFHFFNEPLKFHIEPQN
jgi:ABC-type antimicrobial peptide transport system permease subunit